MEEEKLQLLIREYIDGTASGTSLKELTAYISQDENAEMISVALEKVLAETGAGNSYDENRFNPLLKTILSADRIKEAKGKVFQLYPLTRWVAAAAVIILMIAGGYFYFNKSTQKQIAKTETKQVKNDIAPGGNKAILTLSNGSQIILESAANGTITQQGNTKIIKLDSGQLAYNAAGANGEILYNTISTPKGGQYQIVLADGSKVWLNAASSLRFPTSFSGKAQKGSFGERNVELTGEGYFEVAKNANMPFHVKVNDMTVEVLGTHFNINAYNDESVIKTTLLEGSVNVSFVSSPSPSERAGVRLKPGEQAIFAQTLNNLSTGSGGEIKVATADVDEAVAWKNGRFIFQGNNIQSVMRQLARWYDVDVSYQGNITDEEFVGVINRSRYENISQILEMLEKTRTVSFAINGHSIIVKPFEK